MTEVLYNLLNLKSPSVSLDLTDDKSDDWFRKWLGAERQHAITWANVDPDPCCHMSSQGHNEFMFFISSVSPSSYLYKDSLYSERLSLHIYMYMKWLIQYKDASIENPIVQIRRFYNSFISTTGFPILVNEWLSLTAFLRQPTLVRWHLYVESGPRCVYGLSSPCSPMRLGCSSATVMSSRQRAYSSNWVSST